LEKLAMVALRAHRKQVGYTTGQWNIAIVSIPHASRRWLIVIRMRVAVGWL
jgi:hypothetical protein